MGVLDVGQERGDLDKTLGFRILIINNACMGSVFLFLLNYTKYAHLRWRYSATITPSGSSRDAGRARRPDVQFESNQGKDFLAWDFMQSSVLSVYFEPAYIPWCRQTVAMEHPELDHE